MKIAVIVQFYRSECQFLSAFSELKNPLSSVFILSLETLMTHPATYQGTAVGGSLGSTLATHRVLRNTYALLSLTLLFSAAVAATAVALRLPAPGLILTLAGYFGLLFLVHKVQNSGWAVGAVFALTGFMGLAL